MRINHLRGLVLGMAAAAVAVVGLSCGGGSAESGGGGGGGRTTIRVGVVAEQLSGLTGVSGAKVWGVVQTGSTLSKVAFTESTAATYDLVNPPSGLIGFYVEPLSGYYRIGQFPYIGRQLGGNYQYPDTVPYDTAIYAISPLAAAYPAGITSIGSVRLYPTDFGPPPNKDFP
jgi:hypothetical protein